MNYQLWFEDITKKTVAELLDENYNALIESAVGLGHYFASKFLSTNNYQIAVKSLFTSSYFDPYKAYEAYRRLAHINQPF